jgi:hypothetical protein
MVHDSVYSPVLERIQNKTSSLPLRGYNIHISLSLKGVQDILYPLQVGGWMYTNAPYTKPLPSRGYSIHQSHHFTFLYYTTLYHNMLYYTIVKYATGLYMTVCLSPCPRADPE